MVLYKHYRQNPKLKNTSRGGGLKHQLSFQRCNCRSKIVWHKLIFRLYHKFLKQHIEEDPLVQCAGIGKLGLERFLHLIPAKGCHFQE